MPTGKQESEQQAKQPPAMGRLRPLTIALLLLIAVVTLGRIASTYRIFNATSDEPAHISAGMEWLEYGDYNYEWQHPPLARVATALGPFLKGLRSAKQRDTRVEFPTVIFDEGYNILYSDGDYWRNLTLARLGILPFLLILGATVFAWSRRYATVRHQNGSRRYATVRHQHGSRRYGTAPDEDGSRRYADEGTGLLAVFLLSLLPPILGHAGLATLDVACAATVTLALYQFLRWLDEPTSRRGAILGASVALAFATKYSSIPFLAVCFIPALILWQRQHRQPLGPRLASLAPAALAGFLVLWAAFRFSFAPLEPNWGPHPMLDRIPLAASLLRIPIPFPEFFLGIREVWRHNGLGHDSFLLGEFRTTGWWYFFPVVLAVKTPLGFLILFLVSLGTTLARWRDAASPRFLTAVFFLAILGFSLTSRIDLGVRHILSLYPLMALISAGFTMRALRRAPKLTSLLAILPGLLILATLAESIQAYPDDLAHFNALAGDHPETILCESDLDWGQDLDRLSRRLQELHADHVSIAYFGSAPLDRAGLPRYLVLGHENPEPGYIAISLRYFSLEYARNRGYAWLRPYKPVERIGKSIDLYYLDKLP